MDVWVVVEYTSEGDIYINSVWSNEIEARREAKHRMELECMGLEYQQVSANSWVCEMDHNYFCVDVVKRYLRH